MIPGQVPPRVSLVISLTLVMTISWNLGNGVIFRGAFNAADETLREVDSRIDHDLPETTSIVPSLETVTEVR